MKNPVPMPRTGCSRSVPPVPYMRSRKSWNGSLDPIRAVTATTPTTAGIEALTSAAIDCGGAVGRGVETGAAVQGRGVAAALAARRAAKAIISASAGRAGAWLCGQRGDRDAGRQRRKPDGRNRARLSPREAFEEPLGARIRCPRRPLPVEQDTELVLDRRPTGCRAADIDVAEQCRDDLSIAARLALAQLHERVEH